MNIIYTSTGMPLLETEEGIIYEFTLQNLSVIVGELSVDLDTCLSIKENVLQTISSTISASSLNVNSTSQQINSYISSLTELTRLFIVNDIVSEAINNYRMITTPKPYEKWIWSSELADWIPPINYPDGAAEGVYIWSDDLVAWEPAEPKPHMSWIWDEKENQYVPPISYPVDAQEGEFVWNEDKLTWVLNV